MRIFLVTANLGSPSTPCKMRQNGGEVTTSSWTARNESQATALPPPSRPKLHAKRRRTPGPLQLKVGWGVALCLEICGIYFHPGAAPTPWIFTNTPGLAGKLWVGQASLGGLGSRNHSAAAMSDPSLKCLHNVGCGHLREGGLACMRAGGWACPKKDQPIAWHASQGTPLQDCVNFAKPRATSRKLPRTCGQTLSSVAFSGSPELSFADFD